MAILLFAVVVPAVFLLWFMGAAMRNERLATRQKLVEVYRIQLSALQSKLQRYWRETAAELEKLAGSTPASAAFANCVRSGIVDSAIIFDPEGDLGYPNAPSAVASDFGQREPQWREASQLEFLRHYAEASKRYDALAQATTNANAAARALQAQLRCLARAGHCDAVIKLAHEVFADSRFRQASDPQGRLIAANAELMALECMADRTSAMFRSMAQRLAARLMDYENPALAAPQRRFLMKELQALWPQTIELPTFAAEELAAVVSESHPHSEGNSVLQRSMLVGLWQFTTPDRRVLALLRPDRIMNVAQAVLASDHSMPGAEVALVPPDADFADAFVVIPAGDQMPGWRLALSLKDREFFNASAGRQRVVYFWTGLLVLAVMGVLASVALRLVRRQMGLARLKSDLAATVSHELKTPLASMRVLVETLLDSETLDERRTREYLQLIAQENERLGRLIRNFLAFSRMERRKDAFNILLVPARRIVEAAMEGVRGRFAVSGCRLELQVENDLPPVMADADALAVALANLLENAHKYSEAIKPIVFCARAENGSVIFSVKDNGIGIAPRERRRIFQPFYRSDRRLSRPGDGCGLGLSIVRSIAKAHRGRVWVDSQPGCGSTFTIAIPAVPTGQSLGKEGIA